jgi:hypothetical protein
MTPTTPPTSVQTAVGLLKQALTLLDTPAGVDPVVLKKQAAALIAAQSIGLADFDTAQIKFGDPGGVVKAYRFIKRDDNIDTSANGTPLGVITFDAPGEGLFTAQGTTDVSAVRKQLAQGPAELEFLVTAGWVNAVTGKINTELARQDGSAQLVFAKA